MSEQDLNLGPTGEFPDGKLNKDDEGQIKIAIGADLDNKKVVIDFGTLVAWIAMSPQEARQLAEVIRKNSYLAEGR